MESTARTTAEQLAATESQRAKAAQQEVDALRQRLRDLGIDPDESKGGVIDHTKPEARF